MRFLAGIIIGLAVGLFAFATLWESMEEERFLAAEEEEELEIEEEVA